MADTADRIVAHIESLLPGADKRVTTHRIARASSYSCIPFVGTDAEAQAYADKASRLYPAITAKLGPFLVTKQH